MHGGGGGEQVSTPGKRGGLKKTKIEIIPMIDTMFFLLVFFILSSVGAMKLQGINIEIPKEGAAKPTEQLNEKDKPITFTITVKADGQMYVNAKPVPPSGGVPDLLRSEAFKIKQLVDTDEAGYEKEMKRAIVVINAEPKATHEMVMKAIDEARKPKGGDGTTLLSQFAIANSATGPGAATVGS